MASDFIAQVRGKHMALLMTTLILLITFAGLFAGILGISRVPYAAARSGHFLEIFGRLHPRDQFPSFSVLYVGLASALCCLFSLDALIQISTVIVVMIQSLPTIAAAYVLRIRRSDLERPFRMWFYPLPLVIAFGGWTYILLTSELAYLLTGCAVFLLGVSAYVVRARRRSEWPWAPVLKAQPPVRRKN